MTVAQDWDRQFNLRAAVPDHPMHFARWAERSTQARYDHGNREDLGYGAHPSQRLDIIPAGPGSPLLVFLHGGFWRSFDKTAFTFIAPAFVQRGISVAIVDYALCPDVTVPEILDQVTQSIVFLHRLADRHGYDAGRMVIAGHSVGAHMAVWLGGVDWPAHGLSAQPYRGIVAISGVYDLVPVAASYLNADLRLSPDQARALSPLHAPPPWLPPAVFSVGGRETAAFVDQQAGMVEVWRSRGADARLVPMPGSDHFDILYELAEPEGTLFRATCTLIEDTARG